VAILVTHLLAGTNLSLHPRFARLRHPRCAWVPAIPPYNDKARGLWPRAIHGGERKECEPRALPFEVALADTEDGPVYQRIARSPSTSASSVSATE
jgi:hypothetical protein